MISFDCLPKLVMGSIEVLPDASKGPWEIKKAP